MSNDAIAMSVATLGGLLDPLHSLFYRLKVLELKLGVYDLFITNRIYATVDMHDIVIRKTSDHMHDGINLTDIGQKLVAKALTFAGTFD